LSYPISTHQKKRRGKGEIGNPAMKKTPEMVSGKWGATGETHKEKKKKGQ